MSKTQRAILTGGQPNYKDYEHGLDQWMSSPLFNANECKQIIALGDDMDSAKVTPDGIEDHKIRDGKVKFLVPNETTIPLMDKLLQVVTNANAVFQFDIDSFEAIQLARYDEGDHYAWHKDIGNGQSQYRKLSLSVQLSADSDYEGGDFQFWGPDGSPHSVTRELGSVIVFPSWERHRVTPVTRGTRWSLVAWSAGYYRFR
jgi:PKHD-type hydroxylase